MFQPNIVVIVLLFDVPTKYCFRLLFGVLSKYYIVFRLLCDVPTKFYCL